MSILQKLLSILFPEIRIYIVVGNQGNISFKE
jgi:hypothetical protein